jgi:hypothetical protein
MVYLRLVRRAQYRIWKGRSMWMGFQSSGRLIIRASQRRSHTAYKATTNKLGCTPPHCQYGPMRRFDADQSLPQPLRVVVKHH